MAQKKKNKFNEREISSYDRSIGELALKTGKKDPLIVLTLKDFDRNQGEDFDTWQEDGLLSLALNKLREICNLTKLEATTKQIIKEYPKGVFPPKSEFNHPKHIPQNIAWCTIHIQGKECVIGYFEDNIFSIVFLDKDHRFWITVKKHT